MIFLNLRLRLVMLLRLFLGFSWADYINSVLNQL